MSRWRGVHHGGAGHEADMAMAQERQTLWLTVRLGGIATNGVARL
jgi:hypothetical protein